MREVARQLSIALRSLSRQPGIMLPAVITLALGIGSNMALFAYLSAMLWPPLDAPQAERVVNIYSGTEPEPRLIASYPEFLDIIRLQTAVVDVAGTSRFGASISAGDRSFFGWSALVTGNFFPFFAARPALGRLVQPADDQPGAPPVAVLSHRFWKGSLGGDPAIVGRELRVNGVNLTVIGVAEPGFQGAGLASALYVPVHLSDLLTATPRLENREARMMTVIGRLAPGMTQEKAQAAFDVLGRSLDATAPLADGKARKLVVYPYGRYDPAFDDDNYVDRARTLMAVATAFLLLGCASIANLLLARAISKHREWGIRASLGASRGRLLSGVIAESLVLCAAGGLLAAPVALLLGRRIEYFVLSPPGGLGDWSEGTRLLQFDVRTAAFAVLLTVLCVLLGALGPVMRIFKGDLLDPLKSDASGIGGGGRGGGLASRKMLVVLQVALSMLLLLSGGLLVRTLGSALSVDPGFPVDGLALVTMNIPRNVMQGEGGGAIYQRVLDEARRTPGVSAASLTHVVPISGLTRSLIASSLDRRDEEVEIAFTSVTSDYFRTMEIPIVAGRALDERDTESAPRVAVVSQTLAKRFWGERSALGRMLHLVDMTAPEVGEKPFEVVGVARDTRTSSLVDPPEPLVYLSYDQRKHPRMTLVVRASAPFATLAPALRRSLQQAHPDLSILDLVSGRDHLARGVVEQRMYAEVAGLFALLGLAVAVVGLFGLMSYSVSLRGRELSIRMAIGARPADVERLVLRQGMTLVLVGVIVGLAGAVGLSRFLAGMVYGVQVTDLVTFVSVPAVLAAVSLLACWLPAR
ncbi:MAG TPA: ADOP family duplicated permease, partial [Thermoanaerobaculia bacterium]|nr:ADOP family duplicated permease [Thermoanaerobaculia bacterium]